MTKIRRRPFALLALALAPAAWSLAESVPAPPGCQIAGRVTTNGTDVVIPTGPAVVTSTIAMPGLRGRILDVDVVTNITHARSSDLDMTLTSPAGTVVTLTTDNGGATADVFAAAYWDDQADPDGQVPYDTNAGLVTDHPYPATVSNVTPEEPLGAFVGEEPEGFWTLTISDDTAGSGGVLDSWSLVIRTIPWRVGGNYLSTNLASVAIPAGPGVAVATTGVPSLGSAWTLSNVRVTTHIAHGSPGDLDVTLQSPSGRVVTLTTDNGAGADDVFDGTVWQDKADPGNVVPYAGNPNVASDHAYANGVLASPLTPEEPLAAFDGEDPTGVWTLTISDDTASNGGSLDGWSLLFD
jgi:subtilisin-like proprotein convertase family protein